MASTYTSTLSYRRLLLKQERHAFTLIEVLISVLIISTSILYVLKIYGQNHAQASYISQRNKAALADSLFLTQKSLRYHKEEKSAYDMLSEQMHIDSLESRKILRGISRNIYIPEPQKITMEEDSGSTAEIQEIKLKKDFSSSYFHVNITGL